MNKPTLIDGAIEKIQQLVKFCIESKTDHFDCFFRYYAHISEIEVTVHSDSWEANDDYTFQDGYYITDESSTKEQFAQWFDETMTEIIRLKAESDERWSPENIAKTEADRKKRNIKALKTKLAKLEALDNE